jgi:hypothetical protein
MRVPIELMSIVLFAIVVGCGGGADPPSAPTTDLGKIDLAVLQERAC